MLPVNATDEGDPKRACKRIHGRTAVECGLSADELGRNMMRQSHGYDACGLCLYANPPWSAAVDGRRTGEQCPYRNSIRRRVHNENPAISGLCARHSSKMLRMKRQRRIKPHNTVISKYTFRCKMHSGLKRLPFVVIQTGPEDNLDYCGEPFDRRHPSATLEYVDFLDCLKCLLREFSEINHDVLPTSQSFGETAS